MKEEEAGLISALLGRKSNKPKDIKHRFYECDLRVKKLKNKINILQKQYENQIDLEVNLRLAIQEHCEYLKREVQIIIGDLEAISTDYPDSVTNAKIRDLLKKTRKQIGRSKDLMNSVIQRASAPFFFADNEIQHPDKNTTRSEEVWQKDRPSRKRSASPHCMEDALVPENQKIQTISKRVETNKEQIKKFMEESHARAMEIHKVLNDRVGDGKDDFSRKIVNGGKVERKNKKISKACYIIVIIIIILVVAGSGAAIYLLFY